MIVLRLPQSGVSLVFHDLSSIPQSRNTLAEICFTQFFLCFDTTKPHLKQGVVDPSSQHGDCGNVWGEMSKGTQRVLKGEKGSMIILVISC